MQQDTQDTADMQRILLAVHSHVANGTDTPIHILAQYEASRIKANDKRHLLEARKRLEPLEVKIQEEGQYIRWQYHELSGRCESTAQMLIDICAQLLTR